MKHKFFSIVVVLILLLVPALPVQAADNTGGEPLLDNVTDEAGLLTESEWQTLEQQARQISEQYGVGVYIITVEDYQDYTDGDIYDAADELYLGNSLGLGEDRDGILLLLSMDARDYNLIAYGEFAQYAFNEDGREHLDDFFLDNFGDDAWYDGFSEYLSWSADYLENAENGDPYSDDHVPISDSGRIKGILIRVAIILLVPLAIAGIYTLVLTSKMKSVDKAVEASTYMTNSLHLTREIDCYTHTTETRRKIEEDDDSSSKSSSGGGSGTSGKF